jgi:hypothetical protein
MCVRRFGRLIGLVKHPEERFPVSFPSQDLSMRELEVLQWALDVCPVPAKAREQQALTSVRRKLASVLFNTKL